MITPAQIKVALKAYHASTKSSYPENAMKAALTAAAQVGEPDRLQAVEAAYVHASDEIERLNDKVNATIERCAQVAENYAGAVVLTTKIAAAIRKLKEEA